MSSSWIGHPTGIHNTDQQPHLQQQHQQQPQPQQQQAVLQNQQSQQHPYGYVQPPPVKEQKNLYPAIGSTINRFGLRQPATAASTATASAQKFSSIGTLNVSDLKKPINPLELASGFVESYMERDVHYPELDRIVMQAQSSEYLFFDNPIDMGPLVPFTKTDFINIPDVIFDEYNQTECFTQMGLFPEIERAWITVDNRLYFWHYKNGGDFLSFEDLDKTIIAVKLLRPTPDIFVGTINYLLALFTPSEAIILGVSYVNGELQLFDTGMVLSTRGIDVSHVVSSSNGRIFFCGEGDGTHVWEMTYHKNEGWFRGKCTKICHTRSGLSALAPGMPDGSYLRDLVGTFVKHTQPEKIVAMEIDNTRNILYTLSSTSTIRVYSLFGENGFGLSITYTVNQLQSHLQMINAGNNSTANRAALSKEKLQIVAIEPVTKNESDQIYFVAVTSTGARLYVRVIKSPSFHSAGTGSIQVIQIRYPPSTDPETPPSNSKVLEGTKSTSKIIAPGGFFAVVPNGHETGDKIFVSSLDSGRVVHQMSNTSTSLATPPFFENACFLDVEGYVQSIQLLSPTFSASPKPLGFGNECAAQFTKQAPQVAILTNTGIHIYTRRFPYQVFEALGQDVRTFFEIYGRTETCTSALCVASQASLNAMDDRDYATTVYIEVGGKPHVKTDDENTFSLGASIAPSTHENKQSDIIRLSGRFDGLATYLARIVRDIWSKHVFAVTKVDGKDVFKFSAVKADLDNIQLSLFGVMEFLDKNRAFIDGLSGGPESLIASTSRAEELSLQAEHRGLDALVKLIKSVREGIAFLLLLLDETTHSPNGIEAIMSYLSPEHRENMAGLVFSKFFTTPDGTELARELVTCLVNRSIAEGGSVDTIARILQDRCESYCSSSDVIIYKALEYLRKAKALGNSDLDLKAQNLKDSVRMFQRVAGNIGVEVLKEALTQYCELKYYTGAVEIALAVAGELDRGNLALGYLHDGKQENDARKGLYNQRLQIYELIFQCLDMVDQEAEHETAQDNKAVDFMNQRREEAYSICFSSHDEVFHYAFYDWYFSKGLEHRLLEVTTPYVLPYLETNAKTKLEIADMLWIYCQKQEDYYTAARVLFHLGAKSDFELTLSQRIEFLSRARGYCSCEIPPNLRQATAQLATETQEYMDIASIQDDILRAVKEDARFEEDSRMKALEQLDGKIIPVSDLFNDYADPLNYYEICLTIFQVTDFRGYDEITRCWSNVITNAHEQEQASDRGYEYVSSVVQRLGQQFRLAEFVFPTDFLVSKLEVYALEFAPNAPRGWVVDTFLNAGVSFEALYSLLLDVLERKESPFDEVTAQKRVANDLLYLIEKWTAPSINSRRQVSEIVSERELARLTSIVGTKDAERVVRRLNF